MTVMLIMAFLVSLALLLYYWPFYRLREQRRIVARYDAARRRVEGDLESLGGRTGGLRFRGRGADAEGSAGSVMWYPLRPPVGAPRLEVLGGTKVGWEALILTFGASLLGASARLLVLDLSERHVATHLARLSVETGRRVQYVALPEQGGQLDLFAGLTTREFVECIVAAWHDAETETQARADLARDAFVLEQICQCKSDDSVSLAWLSAAVNALLRVEDARGPASCLSEQEQVKLERLFGERLSGSAQFTDRLLALAGFMRQLNSSGPAQAPIVSLADMNADLTLIEATAEGHTFDKRALAAVIVQVMQKQHVKQRGQDALPTHIFLVGADSVGRGALERFTRFAEDVGVLVTVFFESLQSSGAEMMGGGDAVQYFMRLGRRKDAELAAHHLGKQYKFVLAQMSTMENDSVSETYGEQVSKSHGTSMGVMSMNIGRIPLLIPSVSGSRGTQHSTSWGKQTGKSAQVTLAQNRVHELVVEPEVLQRLGQYALIFRSGADQVSAADCDPELAYSPQLSSTPLDSAPSAVPNKRLWADWFRWTSARNRSTDSSA